MGTAAARFLTGGRAIVCDLKPWCRSLTNGDDKECAKGTWNASRVNFQADNLWGGAGGGIGRSSGWIEAPPQQWTIPIGPVIGGDNHHLR